MTWTCKFQNIQYTTNKSRWNRTIRYGDELRHFIHRTHSGILRRLSQPILHDFLQKYLAITTFTDGGTSPLETLSAFKTNGDHLESYNLLPRPAIKTFNPPASGSKMQMSCYHHHTGSWNFNQSRAEALPVACSRAAWEGREAETTSSTQSSTCLSGPEQMMSPCAKTNQAQNHS